jgi:hypothetical protein
MCLLLVQGLATMASSAMAQLKLTPMSNLNAFGRQEGLVEALGTSCIANANVGTLGTGSYLDFVYTAPIPELGTVLLQCLSRENPNSHACPAGFGPPAITKTHMAKDTVRVPITSDVVVPVPYEICVTARANAAQFGPGTVTETWAANFVGGSPGNELIGGDVPVDVMVIHAEPSLSVGYGSQGGAIEKPVKLPCGKRIPHEDFTVNVSENFLRAMTSKSYENFVDPGAGAGDVTNGSVISVTIEHVPTGLKVDALSPVPCTTSPSIPGYCPGGTLAVSTTGATALEGPGRVVFQYVVTSLDRGVAENTNLPFQIWSNDPLGQLLVPMTATVSIAPYSEFDVPRFAEFNENAAPLTVVDFVIGCIPVF